MSFFQLKELEVVADPQVILAFAEIISFVAGECGMDDLPFDEDQLAANFARSKPPEEREDLLEEPQFALQAAKEEVEAAILEGAAFNSALMGQSYPFEIAPRAGVLLSRKPNIRRSLEGLLYVSMQLHLIYSEELLEFGTMPGGRADKPHLDFTQPFEKLFEVIAGISVANSIDGHLVLLSESRSAASLLKRLTEICRISGVGAPKALALLNVNQAAANDGGIDAVVLDKNGNDLHATILVGATIQKSNLSIKMVTPTSINRFRGFLIDGDALAPYRACFAHPMPLSAGRKGECRLANCSYFHKDLIIKNLRPLNGATTPARNCRAASRRAARTQLMRIEKLVFHIEFDEYPLINVV